MSSQDHKIMVLIANKSQAQTNPAMSVRALLPKEQDKFYNEFKRSVHLYKEKSRQAIGNRTHPMQQPGMPGIPQGQNSMMGAQMGHMVQPSNNQMQPQLQQRMGTHTLGNNMPQRAVNPNMVSELTGSCHMKLK